VHGVTNDTFDDVVCYCRQVAGSIGRLSVTVLGSRDPVAAARLADDLGVAMQLTKLLRDVVEDFERGRTYVPREDLARFGCPADPAAAPPEALSAVIRHQARRNRTWYDRGLPLLPLLDARGAACIATTTGIHTRILDRIERSPNEVLQSGIWLSEAERARIASTAVTTGRRQQHGPVARTVAGHFPAARHERAMIPWHRS
jgi:15-cis-phytoene synthase